MNDARERTPVAGDELEALISQARARALDPSFGKQGARQRAADAQLLLKLAATMEGERFELDGEVIASFRLDVPPRTVRTRGVHGTASPQRVCRAARFAVTNPSECPNVRIELLTCGAEILTPLVPCDVEPAAYPVLPEEDADVRAPWRNLPAFAAQPGISFTLRVFNVGEVEETIRAVIYGRVHRWPDG